MRRLLTALACLVVLVPGGGVPASATERLPVSYNFLAGAVAAGTDPSPNAPGTNLWTCRPSAAHPRPVVLVHGTIGAKDTNWATYGPLLKNHGYCVFALTYGNPGTNPPFGGMSRIQASAQELKEFVAKVRRATGARKVDLIGHSQGTLMPNYWLKFLGGAPYVKNYISLAPLWHGTRAAIPFDELARVFGVPDGAAPLCAACPQMATGSAFMRKMRSGGVAVDGVTYTNIMTKYDQVISPYTSGREPGMRNIVVQDRCASDHAEHFEIASDPIGARIVLNTLDPAHAKPVRCRVVLPYVGPVA